MKASLGLVLFLCSTSALAAAADPASLHKKARNRMKSLDFDAALPLLEQLKADTRVQPSQKAEVLVDLGITHVNLGQVEDAKRDFDDALELNEAAKPPASASPKVQRVFEEAKEARHLRLHPPPPEPKPEPPPPPPVEAKPGLTPQPKAEPAAAVVDAPPPQPKKRMVVVPLVLAALGAAGIGAGAFLAVETQNLARELQGSLHPSAEVMSLESRRSTFGTMSYVGYGVGAALLVAAAALFIFSGGF